MLLCYLWTFAVAFFTIGIRKGFSHLPFSGKCGLSYFMILSAFETQWLILLAVPDIVNKTWWHCCGYTLCDNFSKVFRFTFRHSIQGILRISTTRLISFRLTWSCPAWKTCPAISCRIDDRLDTLLRCPLDNVGSKNCSSPVMMISILNVQKISGDLFNDLENEDSR